MLPTATSRRMILVSVALSAALAATLARVYLLQTVDQAALIERRAPTERTVTLAARRGAINDRAGTELAVSVEAPSIHARPRLIKDRALAAQKLAPILGRTPAEIERRLDPKRRFVWLRRLARPPAAEAALALGIEGIGITPEYQRRYPQGSVAGQLLGFVGIDNKGLEGLERALDAELAGSAQQVIGQRDARGRVIFNDQTPSLQELEGMSVHLTLDERIQRAAERSLAEQVAKHEASGGWAVAIEVRSGAVLALANTPAFDPNEFRRASPRQWRLRPATDTFEPGSVVKPLVYAAALAEGVVRPETLFDAEGGRLAIGRNAIRDSHAHDRLSAAEIVQVSSNIGAYKIAQKLGRAKTYEYYKKFGFGRQTGVGLRGEQPGVVWPHERWAEVTFANVAFGQGLSATPLQITAAIAALANGGDYMTPRLIERLEDAAGRPLDLRPAELARRVVDAESARHAARAMALVTRPGGTAPGVQLPGFTVAGKTGTAQKVNPATRRYDPDLWVASFVGFFPAEAPRVAIGVMIDEPRGVHYGGVVAAPAFVAIANEAIRSLHIEPVPRSERFFVDDEPSPPSAERSGGDPFEATPLEAPVEPPFGAARGLRTPDVRGMHAVSAIRAIGSLGRVPALRGWGRVALQSPEPGEPLDEETEIVLVLEPPSARLERSGEPRAPGAAR